VVVVGCTEYNGALVDMGCVVSISTPNAVSPFGSQKSQSGKNSDCSSDGKGTKAQVRTAQNSSSTKGMLPQSGQSSTASSVRSKSSVNSKGQPKAKHLSENIVGDKSGRDINEFYDINSSTVLGTGVSGSVRTCIHRKTEVQFAMKTLNKRNLKPEKLAQVRSEISIMSQLDHPNILRLFEYFETEHEIFLILDLCKGGELLDRLHEQTDHRYNERTACKLIFTMLSAVRYCHAHNIVHRDLKLYVFFDDDTHPPCGVRPYSFWFLSHLLPPPSTGRTFCLKTTAPTQT
jgi:serine/threonine protein kinase